MMLPKETRWPTWTDNCKYLFSPKTMLVQALTNDMAPYKLIEGWKTNVQMRRKTTSVKDTCAVQVSQRTWWHRRWSLWRLSVPPMPRWSLTAPHQRTWLSLALVPASMSSLMATISCTMHAVAALRWTLREPWSVLGIGKSRGGMVEFLWWRNTVY